MAWHSLQPGKRYPLEDVLSVCEKRIRDGGVEDVEGKEQMLDMMKQHAPETVVWSPGSGGWGRSPFNPNCWQTVNGTPILPKR